MYLSITFKKKIKDYRFEKESKFLYKPDGNNWLAEKVPDTHYIRSNLDLSMSATELNNQISHFLKLNDFLIIDEIKFNEEERIIKKI